jgi:uracil-DNA glycosylase
MTELDRLRAEAEGCTRCDLYKNATQVVFGEGSATADLMLVGEQPGDKEDLEGRPFVGPAGRMLDRGLEEAGIDRSRTYVTNAVKHFKWKAKGKVRLHAKPNAAEISACNVWFRSELETVSPRAVLCLGATAGQALLGRSFRVTRDRGTWLEWPHDPLVSATIHPSAILRARSDEERRAAYDGFVADLKFVAEALAA